jgi:hypothetical protein
MLVKILKKTWRFKALSLSSEQRNPRAGWRTVIKHPDLLR